MPQTQSFENHAKIVPAFHYFVLPIFTLNLGWSIYHLIHAFWLDTLISALLAMALLVLAFCARIFALTVQDRVIRIEMRQHLMQLLPAELRTRIPEFTVNQLVSLRFASDAELPALARKVLDEKITDRKSIKKLIQTWQPDLLRA